MTFIIPNDLLRIQSTAITKGAEIDSPLRYLAIQEMRKNLAENLLNKIAHDCVTSSEYMGHQTGTLHIDVYVLKPSELHDLLIKAHSDGIRHANILDQMVLPPERGRGGE